MCPLYGCFFFTLAQAEADKSIYKIEDMTVTVDKREENIQDVAGSVSAISAIQIEDSGLDSFNDINNYVPNFISYDKIGFDSIRGQSNMASSSRAVGIYVDDVPAKLTNLYDIERIEVLRGPQGNLYGLNSAGGIVNIITKKPDNIFRVNTVAEFGNYDLQSYTASASGPVIKETLFIGLSGKHKTQDNYVEEEGANTHKDSDMSGRVQLRWVPSENTDFLFTTIDEECKSDRGVWSTLDGGPYKIKNMGLDEKTNSSGNIRSLRIKHHAPMFDLTSITAKMSDESETAFGMDFISGGDNLKSLIAEHQNDRWMQEIRLASPEKENPFQWILGGSYLNGKEQLWNNFLKDTGTMAAPTGMYASRITESEIETNTFSFFGQAGYRFYDMVRFTGGIRYDKDKRTTDFKQSMNGTVTSDYEASTTWDAFSPKFIVDYRANDSIMTYASAAKGYKAGGYSPITGGTAEDALFNPEYAWSYELGMKTNWMNNKIIANICGFYTIVDDIQIMYTDPDTWRVSYKNAAEATLWGIEMEAILRPFEGLQVMASFGLLETQFDKHEIKAYEGNSVPLAPEYQAQLAAQYNFLNGLFIRGEAFWNGKSYFTEDNTFSQGAYMTANSRIGYENDNFSINVYVKNMFDEVYYNFANKLGGVDKVIGAEPRTVGVQMTLRF